MIHVADLAECKFQCDLSNSFGPCDWFVYARQESMVAWSMVWAATTLEQDRFPLSYPQQVSARWSKMKKLMLLELPWEVVTARQFSALSTAVVVVTSMLAMVHSVSTRRPHSSA